MIPFAFKYRVLFDYPCHKHSCPSPSVAGEGGFDKLFEINIYVEPRF
jgi:hypothetical protein